MIYRCCFFILVALPSLMAAQSSSFNNWFSLSLDYELIKRLEAKIEIGYRNVDFYSESTYFNAGLSYKFDKYFQMALGWRYAGKGNPMDVDAITNRFHIEGTSKIKLAKRLYLKPRLRYQLRFKDWFVSELGHIPKHSIRARLLLNFNFNKRWTLVTGGEFFTAFYYDAESYIDPFRIINGVRYKFKKIHAISLYYNIEHDISNAYTAHILSLSYSVNLNDIQNKIKKLLK